MRNLAVALQRAGLLPSGTLTDGEDRHLFFMRLDEELDSRYALRARALDEKLTSFELGRALYHLAQRRGFLSNRKTAPKSTEDLGVVKKDIGSLREEMEHAKARTLGEYLAGIDTAQRRVRGRYTAREMYAEEFEAIWDTQSRYYPTILTESLKTELHHNIFYQRPLKSQKDLIGDCELEPGRKRAPWGILAAQRFRYLQLVNNLRAVSGSTGEITELTGEERQILVDALETNGDLTFAGIRRLLHLPRGARFNLELGGEKRMPGNRTAAKLIEVFGLDGWQVLTEQQREAIVEDMRSIVLDDTLKKRGMTAWGLDEEAATRLSQIRLDDGYCSFSRQALAKLLPPLHKGVALQTAIRELYPERWERNTQPLEALPPVRSEYFPELRNPIVERALTELRKVVNAIIHEYGKPDLIRIELGRDLRQSAKQRQSTWKRMRETEQRRARAAKKIAEEVNIENPSYDDITKILFAEECDWTCPYTAKRISMSSLLGDQPQFDVEHIIPYHRSLDNSFLNKTLCNAEENRNVKRNRTPFEAYHASDKWEEILARVKKFKGDGRQEKLRRFRMNQEDVQQMLDSFTARQLNDMRYAARRAKEYLGLLYGGVNDDGIDADGKRRVQATAGQATAILRNAWGLGGILGDGPVKSRDDHRHHAVDAIVVSLTDAGRISQISKAAARMVSTQRRLSAHLDEPWDGFSHDARDAINKIVVSHAVTRRVRGALHEETFYGKPHKGDDGKDYVHIRKPVGKLKPKDVNCIVDPVVRQCVRKRLDELGGTPERAFSDIEKHPVMKAGDGRLVPIHRVRIRKVVTTFPVGEAHRMRHVKSGSNHHMEVVEVLDENGQTIKWEGYVVSMYEAYQRHRNGETIIKRDHGEAKRFRFSLAWGEIIQIRREEGVDLRRICSVWPECRGNTQIGRLSHVAVNDAQKGKDIKKAGGFHSPTVNSLRKLDCQKVTITPLGDIRYAND